MGAGWTDNDLVFCHPDGTMVHPERFSRGFLETVARIKWLPCVVWLGISRQPPGELVSAPGGPVTDGPDLPGGSWQERPLQT
jgi:hypothetical protein